MPTNLNKLRLSLTKHGVHKIAYLISAFDKDEILNHLSGDFNGINIDYAQARSILSCDQNDVVPELWNQIKKYGKEDIFDVVFISNIFSHIDLINTMIKGIENDCIIKRGGVIDGKAYTNFAHTIDQFGYSIEHTPDLISFDISRIFYKYYLSKFIYDILTLKLTTAGWDKKNSLIQECQNLELNKVFGLSKKDFEIWMQGNIDIDNQKLIKVKAKRNFNKGIKFKTGHNTKFEGDVTVKAFDKHTATLTHNLIQNNVFVILSNKYPHDEIGTEVQSNIGSIDIVKKRGSNFTFYEIKTSDDVKISIRQALSQLLEYAYWNNIEGVEQLIIISPTQPTHEATKYIKLLRDKFNIPIFYQFYNLQENNLFDPI